MNKFYFWKVFFLGVATATAFAFVASLIVGQLTKVDSSEAMLTEETVSIVVIEPMVDKDKNQLPTTLDPVANTNTSVTPINNGLVTINPEDFFKEPYPNLLYRGWKVAPLAFH